MKSKPKTNTKPFKGKFGSKAFFKWLETAKPIYTSNIIRELRKGYKHV